MDAIRFWEPRRLAYNLVLVAATGAWLALTWPHFRPALTLPSLAPLAVLALLANVCYCAAYLVDIPLQRSSQLPLDTSPVDPVVAGNPLRICPRQLLDRRRNLPICALTSFDPPKPLPDQTGD